MLFLISSGFGLTFYLRLKLQTGEDVLHKA